MLETHQHYEQSFRLFRSLNPAKAFCGTHNLAEVYAILTRYPNKDRLTADQALIALETIQNRVTIVSLTLAEYVAAIRKYAGVGVVGGNIYDGLIAECALKADVDVLYTWNIGHFQSLGEDIARKVRTPD